MRWRTEDGQPVPFRRLNVKLPPDDHKSFRETAAVDGRSMQQILIDLVRKFVKDTRAKKENAST